MAMGISLHRMGTVRHTHTHTTGAVEACHAITTTLGYAYERLFLSLHRYPKYIF